MARKNIFDFRFLTGGISNIYFTREGPVDPKTGLGKHSVDVGCYVTVGAPDKNPLVAELFPADTMENCEEHATIRDNMRTDIAEAAQRFDAEIGLIMLKYGFKREN